MTNSIHKTYAPANLAQVRADDQARAETAVAKQDVEEEKKQAAETPAKPRTDSQKKRRPNRGSLPPHLPRVHMTIEPESTICPCCQDKS